MKIPFFNKGREIAGRRGSDDPNAKILKRFTQFGRPSATYSEALEAQHAMHHIVVYRCLDKIATTFQGIRFYVERDPAVAKSFRTSEKKIAQLEEVLKNPNNNMNGAQLQYWIALVWALYGRIPLKVGVSSAEARPNGLYPLDPGLTEELISGAGEIYAYKYGKGANASEIPAMRKATKTTRGVNEDRAEYPSVAFAHEIVRPNIGGVTSVRNNNNSALKAIGLPASVVTLLLQRAYDTASGHPNSKYIVATEKTLTEPQKGELRGQFEQREVGEEESGNVLILGNTKVQVEKLDNNLSDIHSKMPLDDMSRHIAGAFGVPIALLGFAGADGSKFANNYEESRLSFFEDTIVPGYCEPVARGLTEIMCPEGYVVRADLDTIPALQDRRAKRAKDLESISFLSIDEKRELCGYGPYKDTGSPGGKLPAPKATTPVQDPPTNPEGE